MCTVFGFDETTHAPKPLVYIFPLGAAWSFHGGLSLGTLALRVRVPASLETTYPG